MGSNNPPGNNNAVAIPANGQDNGQPRQNIPGEGLSLGAGNNQQSSHCSSATGSQGSRRPPKNLQVSY